MPTGYQRQSVASIVNGNVINASDFNNEYNAILAAFNASTGHIHDGTTVGGGAPILAVHGVSFPASPSTNTVPVVTSANTITYEKVPNAALANSKVTLGSTDLVLGTTTTTVDGLTLTSPTLNGTTNAQALNTSSTLTLGAGLVATGHVITGGTLNGSATSGTFTLGGPVTATGRTITGGTFSTSTLANCTTNGNLTLGGNFVATGFAVTGGNFNSSTINSPTISSPTITGTTSLGATTTTATLTLGAGIAAAGNIISNAVINAATIGNGSGTGAALGANLSIAGFAIAGGGTGTILNCALDTQCVGVTQATANNSTKLATTEFVQNNLNLYAPLASPALTGNPTATTQIASSNSTRLATTAYVQSQYTATNAANGYLQTGFGQPYMQWGIATTNGSGIANITFPNAFGSAVYSIQITPTGSITNLAPKIACYSDTISNTAFRIHTADSASGTASAATVYWLAIGI